MARFELATFPLGLLVAAHRSAPSLRPGNPSGGSGEVSCSQLLNSGSRTNSNPKCGRSLRLGTMESRSALAKPSSRRWK